MKEREPFLCPEDIERLDLLNLRNLFGERLDKVRKLLIKAQSTLYKSQATRIMNQEEADNMVKQAIEILEGLI